MIHRKGTPSVPGHAVGAEGGPGTGTETRRCSVRPVRAALIAVFVVLFSKRGMAPCRRLSPAHRSIPSVGTQDLAGSRRSTSGPPAAVGTATTGSHCPAAADHG